MIMATGSDTAVAGEPPRNEIAPSHGLERECRTYAEYLTGQPPNPYVVHKYLDFHQKFGVHAESPRFDRFLLSTSARGPFWARLADTYGSVWRKNSIVRSKIVLTLALLECTPPTFEMFDRVPAGGWMRAVLRLAIGASAYGLTLFISAAFFTLARLWLAVRER